MASGNNFSGPEIQKLLSPNYATCWYGFPLFWSMFIRSQFFTLFKNLARASLMSVLGT
jgi:hypothetical protein